MKVNIKSLLFHVLVPLMLSYTIIMLIPDYKDYLNSLKKPLELPSIVFQIVWPVLYVLIGISAYIIDNKNSKGSSFNMKLYYILLIINLTYPIVFFYLHDLVISSIMIVTLLVLGVIITIRFIKESKISGLLFIPYNIWLVLATYIHLGTYYLNTF